MQTWEDRTPAPPMSWRAKALGVVVVGMNVYGLVSAAMTIWHAVLG